MIEQALMNVILGRYPPNDERVARSLTVLVEDAMVVRTEDGWALTWKGTEYLTGLGWEQKWCRFEPFGKGMRPGVFDSVDDARSADVRYCQTRMAERALIRPVFVNEEQEALYA